MQKYFIIVLIISLGAITASCGKKDADTPPTSPPAFFPTVSP